LLVPRSRVFGFTFVKVIQDLTRVRSEMTVMEVAINLTTPKDVEVAEAIRGQVSSDLPISTAPPAGLEQSQLPAETAEVIGPLDTGAPLARVAPGGMVIDTAPPRLTPPGIKSEGVTVQP